MTKTPRALQAAIQLMRKSGQEKCLQERKKKKKVTCDKDPSCTIGSDTVDEDVRAREMKSKKKEKEK